MLRIAEPLFSSRFGGWALERNPPRRNAEGGQHWSLLIVTAAALVAMLAVVFDLRISSGPELPVVLPRADAMAPAEPTAVQQPTVTPPPSASREAAPSGSAAAAAPSASTTRERSQWQAAPEPAERSAPAQASSNNVNTSQTGAPAGEQPTQATAAATVVDDPASRIREYLGLHAGAQLPVSFSYEVQPGDTASSIAERFGLQDATVLFNNWDIYDPNHLGVGQRLVLPPVDGLIYTVQSGDTLDALLQRYQADELATLSYAANRISSPEQIYAGQTLLLVHGSASLAGVGSGAAVAGGAESNTSVWTEPEFVLYLRYDKITDYFGTPRTNAVGYHTGVDYTAPVGELIGAAAGGRISVATWDPSYGNWVEIDHGGGYRSRYAHLDIINVREGQSVDQGDYIGTVGNTGNSSGAHLHFEIIVNGEAVNPLAWLN